jgi:hypothetical protein
MCSGPPLFSPSALARSSISATKASAFSGIIRAPAFVLVVTRRMVKAGPTQSSEPSDFAAPHGCIEGSRFEARYRTGLPRRRIRSGIGRLRRNSAGECYGDRSQVWQFVPEKLPPSPSSARVDRIEYDSAGVGNTPFYLRHPAYFLYARNHSEYCTEDNPTPLLLDSQ